eukprot:scaffold27065_cov150-Skeletonema_menzelii.AAC.5
MRREKRYLSSFLQFDSIFAFSLLTTNSKIEVLSFYSFHHHQAVVVATMSFIPDTDQAPGYCSVATAPLTTEQISRIVTCATSGNETAGITIISEKELGLKGRRQLHILDTKDRTLVVEYAGVRKAKFVKKDLERFQAMIDAYEGSEKEVLHIVLLKEDGTICRRNTLKALASQGVVVMRCPASDTDSDSDDSSSSSSDDSE